MFSLGSSEISKHKIYSFVDITKNNCIYVFIGHAKYKQ